MTVCHLELCKPIQINNVCTATFVSDIFFVLSDNVPAAYTGSTATTTFWPNCGADPKPICRVTPQHNIPHRKRSSTIT